MSALSDEQREALFEAMLPAGYLEYLGGTDDPPEWCVIVDDALKALDPVVTRLLARAWDQGFIARTGDTPLYSRANEWGNPYRGTEVTS